MRQQFSDQQTADPYADHGAILDLVKRKKTEWSRGREPFIVAAWRNLRFLRGHQWEIYDRRQNRFRPPVLPKGTPMPVTNKYAETLNALVSVFARVEPRLNFAPGSPSEPEDRAAADVASRAIEVVEDEVSIRTVRQQLAAWVGYTGVGWLETGYDPDPAHGTRDLVVDTCGACGNVQAPGTTMCEACGGTALATVVQTVPVGRMYVDIVPLFEMFYDARIPEWTKQTEYIREKSTSVDVAQRRWGAKLGDTIQPSVVTGPSEIYGESLPHLGPALDQTRSVLGISRQPANSVREVWYWSLPTETYPEGLLAVLVGEQVAHAGPLPYGARQADGTRKPFLPHVQFPQQLVPGSAFPKTVGDDLAEKQRQRNQWESIIQSCGMRMGSPLWGIPTQANVGTVSGEPAAVIRYNWQPNMPTPNQWRVPGQGIPLAFIQMLDRIDKDFESIAGTFDIIKGARPAGVSAGIALQILQERGMSRFGPQFILWENAWAEWARQALEIFREFATEERLHKIKGRDGAWEVKKFLGADLRGRVDVIPEAGSSMPRSTLVERAETEQLAAMGVLPMTNPETQFEVVKLYGKTHLMPSLAADTKAAIMEHEAFEAMAQDPRVQGLDVETVRLMDYTMLMAEFAVAGIKLPRVRPSVDDHAVHSREDGAWLKSERSRQLPEIIQVLAEKHKEYHDQLMIQQAQVLQGIRPQATPDATSGFLARPAMTNVMNTSSGGSRMAGDFGEMEQDMAASGAL